VIRVLKHEHDALIEWLRIGNHLSVISNGTFTDAIESEITRFYSFLEMASLGGLEADPSEKASKRV
jgi:hypothetical protein